MIIWIIGPLACGKTTQNKLLLASYGNGKPHYIEDVEDGVMYSFTNYGDISSLGLMNESQCCGLDRVSSKLKNEGIKLSLQKALEKSTMVVVESIMSASTWFPMMQSFNVPIFIFSLECSFEENVRRLRKRKWDAEDKTKCIPKDFWSMPLTDANYEFIRKTRNQYAGIFKKFIGEAEGCVIQMDGKTPQVINKEIRNFIVKNV